MGSIIFGPMALPDNLTEIAGYKAGLAMSIEEICDHLTGTSFPDTIAIARHLAFDSGQKITKIFTTPCCTGSGTRESCIKGPASSRHDYFIASK